MLAANRLDPGSVPMQTMDLDALMAEEQQLVDRTRVCFPDGLTEPLTP